MTKQELEKAIENKDTIWYIDSLYDTPKDMLLNGNYGINSFVHEDIGRVYYLYDIDRKSWYRMDYIFKTQAQAKHYSYRSNIARLETLPFLTWEEFLEEKEIKFNSKKSEYLMIYLAGNITIYQCYYNDNGFKLELRIFDEEATEANFYKAYDECVRLFKQGE